MDARAAVRSVAALNGNAATESSGLWILVGADAIVHRLGHLVVHLAALGLDPDLFKIVNPEAFVAGIYFLILGGLTSSKITALSVVLSAEA